MSTSGSGPGSTAGDSNGTAAADRDVTSLRTIVIAVGIIWSALFVIVGLSCELQMFGDGSLFSYSVAVQDAWAFHWHNISGRLFGYLFSYVPAEAYVELTRDARGGIFIYGFLFFVAPLLGLIATFLIDGSKSRIIFSYACAATGCLCPLVFGFPTEMWMANALFWPTLAICHYSRGGIRGCAAMSAMLLALVLTHEGALVFAAAILATLALRGIRNAAFLRGAAVLLGVMLIWSAVKLTLRPDDHIAGVLASAAFKLIDIHNLASGAFVVLLAALAGYATAFGVLRRRRPVDAHFCAVLIVGVALIVYWAWYDRSLHAEDRYLLRTVLLIATPVIGALATVQALDAEGRLKLAVPFLPRLAAALADGSVAGVTVGAVLVVTLVNVVETAKFVTAWTAYKDELRALATGAASDPALGDPLFVSSDRIDAGLNRLTWSSTTHFLSVLVAPGFAPGRLVVDPAAGYFWLSCETATRNHEAARAVPSESRRLIRTHACLHR